ncbi:putative acetyltransferase [Panicum miliaceum]|uniref:Acetyltransferase n=1 Tax=Panicum miliaceum TaxID=4540 RepID=A0A3L6SFJ1_PANMI|nr:putative acetyltransferase [Panicum miliaceum]
MEKWAAEGSSGRKRRASGGPSPGRRRGGAGAGSFSTNGVLMGRSPRFNMYGCDFGWGKALAASQLHGQLDGREGVAVSRAGRQLRCAGVDVAGAHGSARAGRVLAAVSPNAAPGMKE